ncbi:hypothetical protein D6C78_04139, partial [Aureobasidium pullulans]
QIHGKITISKPLISRVTFKSSIIVYLDIKSIHRMDNHAIATAFGILGTVLWSLQLFPQIWKNWRRHSSESLSPLFFLAWAIAGIPLGVYNIVDDLNIALQIQPNIFLLLSIWIGLICLVCCFRISHRTKSKDPGPILEDV